MNETPFHVSYSNIGKHSSDYTSGYLSFGLMIGEPFWGKVRSKMAPHVSKMAPNCKLASQEGQNNVPLKRMKCVILKKSALLQVGTEIAPWRAPIIAIFLFC